MSEPLLNARNALGKALEQTRSAVSIELVDGLTAAHVAARKGQEAALAQVFQQSYGLTLPQTSSAVTAASVTAVWAGPGQWLVLAPATGNRDLDPELRGKLGVNASVADQSDARTFVRVSGPASRALLAKLLPIDVHQRAFAPGAAAITHAAHIGVIVWREADGKDAFVLGCIRSYAKNFWHILLESAQEFGTSVG